jgi:hypothetical protein
MKESVQFPDFHVDDRAEAAICSFAADSHVDPYRATYMYWQDLCARGSGVLCVTG